MQDDCFVTTKNNIVTIIFTTTKFSLTTHHHQSNQMMKMISTILQTLECIYLLYVYLDAVSNIVANGRLLFDDYSVIHHQINFRDNINF